MKRIALMILLFMATLVVKAQYNVGDFYNENGVRGMVVLVEDNGKHGLVMSLKESKADWLTDKSLALETTAFYEDDGMKNLEAIEKYVNESGKSLKAFPLFAWARSLGNGWYIPSRNEVIAIWKSINGGNLDFNKKGCKLWKQLDKKLKKLGGESLFCANGSTVGFKMLAGWISSTEAEGGKIYSINTEKGKNLVNHPMGAPNVKIQEYQLKKNSHRSEGDPLGFKRVLHFEARAVHKF